MASDEDLQGQGRVVPGRRLPGRAPRVLHALVGALARVARAAPDYLRSSRRGRPGKDTGEWPAPDASRAAGGQAS